MYWTPEQRNKLSILVALAHRIPLDGTEFYWEVQNDRLRFQASNQADVRKVRALFPGAIWTKEFNPFVLWWTYTTTVEGVIVDIYGCNETPPTCRLVEETYTERVKVPTTFEEREVTKTRFRPECGPEASND